MDAVGFDTDSALELKTNVVYLNLEPILHPLEHLKNGFDFSMKY